MIQFLRGLRAKYSSATMADAIYFATDTGELLVNGVNYGADQVKLKDVTFDTAHNKLTFTKGDDTIFDVNFGDKLLSDADRSAIENLKEALEGAGFTAIYDTKLDDNIATTEKLGGIAAGTKVSALKGRKITEVLDDLIFPTVQPTKTDPTVTLALKSTYKNIQEVGATGPVLSNFTLTYNQGTIKIGNTTTGVRAGAKTSEVVYANTENNAVTEVAGTVALGTTNYYYKVNYAAGDEPKDSKGNPATSLTRLPAGSKVSGAVAVYGVYPFYGTTTDANIANQTVTKLPLTNATNFTCTLAAESATSKQVFKLPHTVTKIELKDPFGNWVSQAINEFPKTTENIDVNGTSVSYNVYTRNQGQNGATEFRITYTK